MGPKAREALRSAWAALIAWLRARARKLGGVAKADRARRESDWDLAIQTYQSYLDKAPRDLGVRIRLIKTLYAAGRLDEAEDLVRGSITFRPDKPELTSLLSDILVAREVSIPVKDYDRFRRGLTIPTAPTLDLSAAQIVTALVDGREKSTSAVSLTLESLRASNVSVDRIIVWSSGQQDADQDANGATIVFGNERIEEVFAAGTTVLSLDAGVVLDPEALGWLLYAIRATGAVAAYGDDDRRTLGACGAVWSEPAFHAAPDPWDLATTPRAPSAVVFGEKTNWPSGLVDRRQRLIASFEVGSVAHVPLLLATAIEEPRTGISSAPSPEVGLSDDPIRVIIPTRDEGAALAVMIESLIGTARNPDLLEIVIVDNGSRDRDTLMRLQGWARDGSARVLIVDEPFNWSRLNNLAAAGAKTPILLFANNDMQMLTRHWDDHLRASLALAGVGVVGARLTYPNGRVQHAGMALGALGGRPVHEGLGASESDDGPLRRWRRTRPAAAVTGAFMGVRRELFEAAGGFNAEQFAVGCNDIDFCLRARAQGWSVLYAADVELVHWESRSRGHDDTEPKMRRAQAELAALDRLWGEDARRDPSRNPHWIAHETLLFHGLRQPAEAVIESWIRNSAEAWRSSGSGRQAPVVTPMSR